MAEPHYYRIERGGNRTGLVFVHGILGHYRDTWGDFPDLITQDSRLNHCDILCWGYPSRLEVMPRLFFLLRILSYVPFVCRLPFLRPRSPSLEMVAEALRTDLKNPQIGGGYNQLLLIGHSMGGLVIMQMIISAISGATEDTTLLDRIKHVLLYATPCNGVQLPAIVNFHRQARSITCGSDFVEKLCEEWLTRIYRVRREDPLQAGKRYLPLTAVAGTEDELVPPDSVRAYSDDVATVQANHSGICKPHGRDHTSFQVLKRAVLGSLPPPTQASDMILVNGNDAVIAANIRIVETAEEHLFATGSRSRDSKYLETIEAKLRKCPRLIYWRILMGPPRQQAIKDHLLRVLAMRSPGDRSVGFKTTHIGLFEDDATQAEIFLCGNEKTCLVVLPSLEGLGKYTTAMLFSNSAVVRSYLRLTQELYAASRTIEDINSVRDLELKVTPPGVG